jgi:hypothetical protein
MFIEKYIWDFTEGILVIQLPKKEAEASFDLWPVPASGQGQFLHIDVGSFHVDCFGLGDLFGVLFIIERACQYDRCPFRELFDERCIDFADVAFAVMPGGFLLCLTVFG